MDYKLELNKLSASTEDPNLENVEAEHFKDLTDWALNFSRFLRDEQAISLLGFPQSDQNNLLQSVRPLCLKYIFFS